ncbi:MAG: hypothetical protein ACI9T7_000637 [Oleiphilaceae bacterium]|jgi:hypothetical protein
MRFLYFFFFIILSFSSNATNYYAVVVGVSEYPSLDKELNLTGPKYDVLRVNAMLFQQGLKEENIRLLADGIENGLLPTKANIVEAITSLEGKLLKGDFVYLHFSGHGSQQPAVQGNDVTDGLDEIFLPRDIGTWSVKLGVVENSLTDDEVNILLTRLRNKGADVWIVFDSCHSGTMTRSVSGQRVISRSVKPKSLGINANTVDVSMRATGEVVLLKKDQAGSLVAFAGAQSNEEAPEMELSNGDGKVPQGLFTHTMTSLIGQNPNMSYRQLAQGVLSAYNSLPWYKTTPHFEGGEALDKPIFNRDAEVSLRYPVGQKKGQYFIQGGQINGLENGALVEVFESVVSKDRIALLEISNAQIASSEGILLEGKIAKRNTFAELTRPAYPKPLTVKWQERPDQIWLDALQQLLGKSELLSRTIKWVDSDQPADVSLYVADKLLYFFTIEKEFLPCSIAKKSQPCNKGGKYLASNYSLTEKDSVYHVLENGISRFVRARNLMRLSLSMAGKSPISSAVVLNGQSVQLDKIISAQDGDELHISFTNHDRKPVDLTVFFVDSGLGIYQVFPELGYSGRLFMDESAEFEGVITASSTGEEQFVVISVPTSRQSPPMSLSHIQQDPMESLTFFKSTNLKTRGNGAGDIFAQMLGDAPQVRAFTAKAKSKSEASVSIIRLKTQ